MLYIVNELGYEVRLEEALETVQGGTIFSERELMFMFAICRRPSVCLSVCLSSVCRLSSVCNVRVPYSAD